MSRSSPRSPANDRRGLTGPSEASEGPEIETQPELPAASRPASQDCSNRRGSACWPGLVEEAGAASKISSIRFDQVFPGWLMVPTHPALPVGLVANAELEGSEPPRVDEAVVVHQRDELPSCGSEAQIAASPGPEFSLYRAGRAEVRSSQGLGSGSRGSGSCRHRRSTTSNPPSGRSTSTRGVQTISEVRSGRP